MYVYYNIYILCIVYVYNIYIYMEIRSYPLFLFRKNLVIWFIRAMHVVLSEIVHGISLSRKEKTTFFPVAHMVAKLQDIGIEIFEIPSSRTSSYLRILCFRNLQMSSFLSGDWPVKTTTKLQHVYLTYHGSRSHHMQCSKLFRLVSIYII